MHAIDIGIGGHDDFVVAQSVEAVLDVEGRLQEVELLVLVDHLLGQSEAVERLAAQREDGLRVHVAALGDAAAGRVALGDEDAGVLLLVALGVVEVDAAVAQLAVVQIGLLATFAGQLCHAGHGLAFAFAVLHLLQDDVGHVGILVQVVVHLLLDEVADELVDGYAALGGSGQRAQLDFRLALEKRFLDVDADGGHQSVADVGIVVVLARIVLDDLGDVFLEGAWWVPPSVVCWPLTKE